MYIFTHEELYIYDVCAIMYTYEILDRVLKFAESSESVPFFLFSRCISVQKWGILWD